ncbi:microtubule-associated proteins 1A/1B light chain 3C-like [Lynx rufus]|uniref:microtubule-associated proteins 1A/1B light chain 3C-like n=1 Tax=Lynx rufus TaxID=61384 RepID=UPI001F125FA7|nr:microtubule-associated proteins 1A/1B light chain 3C-like [Lynx rufus]
MQPPQKTQSLRPFKERKSLATRREEVARIQAKFPSKILVRLPVVEHYPRERFLPPLDKTRFLVLQALTMTLFLSVIRSRLVLGASEAFYLLVNNKSLVSMSVTMAEVYRDYQDEDGLVYVTHSSQEMFDCLGSRKTLPSSAEHV